MRKHEELTKSLRASAAAMPSDAAVAVQYRAAADALEAQAREIERLRQDAARYRWLAGHCRSTAEHWGGRWSIIIDGPAPKSHDSEDDFDAAVDAARKQGANHG